MKRRLTLRETKARTDRRTALVLNAIGAVLALSIPAAGLIGSLHLISN